MTTAHKRVGQACKVFRKQVLNLTLDEFCTDVSIKTISAFENGRSTNINHLDLYLNKCNNDFERDLFITYIVTNLKGCALNESKQE